MSTLLRPLRHVTHPSSRLTTTVLACNATQTRTYYSIYHPTPSPFDPTTEKILRAAYAHVPTHGFTLDALHAGLRETSHPEVSIHLFPRGAYDLIHYHHVTSRLALKDTIQFPPQSDPSQRPLSLTEKVTALTWARLQANAPIIAHYQHALAQMSLLENIPASLKELGDLSDEIWYLAGDTQVDFGWYTKRAQLSAVYASAEVFMTTDESEGFSRTREFLGRRLEDQRIVGGSIGGALGYAGFVARNGLGLARSWGLKV